jgi:hypothetical protein
MLAIRCDPNVPGEVLERVRPPLERAARRWTGLGEAFVYCFRDPGGARELMIRVSTPQGVVPVLFRLDTLDAEGVETALKGTLMRGDL